MRIGASSSRITLTEVVQGASRPPSRACISSAGAWFSKKPTNRSGDEAGGALRALPPPVNSNGTMKQSDLPPVRPIGAKLSPEALRFVARVADLFPGSERDIIIIIREPVPANTARVENGQPISARGKPK